MIGSLVDSAVGVFSPSAAVRRMQARRLMRAYAGAEANRLTNNAKPKNQSANNELMGPFGADALRAWARKLVRDNAYAWGVVDTIVSSVIENGIRAQSTLETIDGEDVEATNWTRDEIWEQWCEVADFNGELTFFEIQRMAQREMVEAGEVLIHFVKTPNNTHRGIHRPVPLALELIEADRLAVDRDTYQVATSGENRIVRGVELDEYGKPVAYLIYPQHPNDVHAPFRHEPVRILAGDVLHLFRRDRIGQTRGVTWFAPILSWLRDLGVYVDNEIQASAVASCFGVAIKTEGPVTGLMGPTGEDATDDNGNQFDYLEPAMVVRLNPGESVESINPGRPNSASGPWIELMLRGIAVGTGLSYEVVARDYSKTNYSSSRTSQLEDRRRFRCWQRYMVNHLCQPVWDRFCEAAATAGLKDFPTTSELLDDRRKAAPVEWQTPEWEWVDPTAEQAASQNSIDALQSTYATELGSRGRNWKSVFYQRAKEEKLKRSLGLATLEQKQIDADVEAKAQAQPAPADAGTGEMSQTSRLQWQRNQKAIDDVLQAFASGAQSRAKATVMLSTLGLSSKNIEMLLDDASDGTVDGQVNLEESVNRRIVRNCGTGEGGFKPGNDCGDGGGSSGGDIAEGFDNDDLAFAASDPGERAKLVKDLEAAHPGKSEAMLKKVDAYRKEKADSRKKEADSLAKDAESLIDNGDVVVPNSLAKKTFADESDARDAVETHLDNSSKPLIAYVKGGNRLAKKYEDADSEYSVLSGENGVELDERLSGKFDTLVDKMTKAIFKGGAS